MALLAGGDPGPVLGRAAPRPPSPSASSAPRLAFVLAINSDRFQGGVGDHSRLSVLLLLSLSLSLLSPHRVCVPVVAVTAPCPCPCVLPPGQCSRLRPPHLGSLRVLQGSGTDVGTVLTFQCSAEHQLEGAATVSCVWNGNSTQWTAGVPSCKGKGLPQPAPPSALPVLPH